MHFEPQLKKLAALAVTSAPTDYDFGGTWKNDLGSTMTLTVNQGRLTGTYRSPESGVGVPVTGEISGFCKLDVMAIVVRWNISAASMTTWVGQVERNGSGDQIKTLWHLIRDIIDENEDEDLWTSIWTGSDIFRRI